MGEKTIHIQGLTKSFNKTKVLDGVNLTVERGTMLALLGPNGAGKTTTIRILSTLMSPDSGSVSVNGFDVIRDPEKVRENIGLTGQYAAVDEYLTGRENLVMMARLYHLDRLSADHRTKELLEQFSLTNAADRRVKEYSGGMRRRLDLAASLVAVPPVLFLDEPTTGLDPRSRLAMWDIIQQLLKGDITILLTTQYLEEADRLASKIAVIDDGKIIAEGSSDELKAKVGRERLVLTFSRRNGYEVAAKEIRGDDMQINPESMTISLATDGSVKEVKRILDQMNSSGIEIESLSLNKPTLDDVFMNLTGHRVETEQAQQE